VKAAQESDVVVAFVGLSPSLEGEEMPVQLEGFKGGDRTAIDLPAAQEDLLKALGATGKPLIVVLQNGSALAVNWAAEHAGAVLEAWYPGEEGGTAIAETLAGDNNPAGRLPLTFYSSLSQLPDFTDYSMKNRTYRYFDGKPLYSFGYGLSYTTFTYTNLKGPGTVDAGDPAKVQITVTNSGSVAGDDVVELYLTQPKRDATPQRELAGFQRIHLAPKQSTQVEFTIDPRFIAQVDDQGNRVIVPGRYTVYAGGSQPGYGETQTAEFNISGEKQLPK